MRLRSVIGLDHVVLLVRDLDRAAETWRRLGFTVSPRGLHSPQLGSGNYTIMFRVDYIELLGIVGETPHNAPSRAFLERQGEGIERAAFTARDAAAGADELRGRGFDALGPTDFGRPVTLPNGTATDAKFRIFQWPIDEQPGGLRIFACQHFTRDAVWIPELQKHANTAIRLVRIEILTDDPTAAAEHMARLIEGDVHTDADGALRVPSGGGRADFVFVTRHMLALRYPGLSLDGLASGGGVSIVMAVEDLDTAARAAGPAAIKTAGGVAVPPAYANGVVVSFVEA